MTTRKGKNETQKSSRFKNTDVNGVELGGNVKQKCPASFQQQKSSEVPVRLAKQKKNQGSDRQTGASSRKKRADDQRKNSKTLSFRMKRKKRKKEKNKAGSTLIQARRKPTRAVCSGWSYPIQAELSLVLGGVPVLPTSRGPSCGSSALGRWRVWPFTRLHRRRAEPGSSPHCPSETP